MSAFRLGEADDFATIVCTVWIWSIKSHGKVGESSRQWGQQGRRCMKRCWLSKMA
jgi:hypothetical protein